MEQKKLPANLCIFEDRRFPNFFPLSLNKPVFDLTAGTGTLRKRIIDEVNPKSLVLVCRPYLVDSLIGKDTPEGQEKPILLNENYEEDTLFLNGRLLTFGKELEEFLAALEKDSVIQKNGIAVAAWLTADFASSFIEFLLSPLNEKSVARVILEIREVRPPDGKDHDARKKGKEGVEREEPTDLRDWTGERGVTLKHTELGLVSYYWQLIGENGRCIVDDYQNNPLRGVAPESELFRGVDCINEEDIVIASEVEVRSGTVLDASEGPIIIADRVRIEPNAIICGPCYIGEDSIIRGGAKIGHGTTIGSQCRIGGEVEETIVADYSNKQHEGFLGHSYIGSWVNLGAGSCNSDLKNNYGKVKAWCKGCMRDTGRRFLGVIIADHAKIAINTRLNTGTVIGFNANVLTPGFPQKFVPSFTWTLEPEFMEHDLQRAVATAEIMMDRRNVEFTSSLGGLFKTLFRFCRQSGHTI